MLVSIITPVFNRETEVCRALDSVRKQSYRPLEIVVVDDGSTDETLAQCQQWWERNKESGLTFLLHSQENSGPAGARNKGFELSTGELIQYLDSDDRIHENRIAILVELFESDPELDFVQTGFEGFCSECEQVIEVHHGNPASDQLSLALRGRLWGNTLRASFRRCAVERTSGWNEQMRCFEDYEFVVRALGVSRKNAAISDVLASASRGGPDARISNMQKSFQGRNFRIMCEEALGELIVKNDNTSSNDRSAFVSRIYGLGIRCYAKGWIQYGKRCWDLANRFDVKLDSTGSRRQMACRFGMAGSIPYSIAGWAKLKFSSKKSSRAKRCDCQSIDAENCE